MTISTNLTTFGGFPVRTVEDHDPFPEVGAPVAWRASLNNYRSDAVTGTPDEELAGWLERLPSPETVQALIVGEWPEAFEEGAPVQALVDFAPRLPALRHLFVGEMTFEECEISWIQQGDVTPLVEAYAPQLETLFLRGTTELVLAPFTAAHLVSLGLESGGLDTTLVRAIADSTLPALRSLEVWLGTSDYGANASDDDLAALLSGAATPALSHLGLKNSDEPLRDVTALAASPLLPRLASLDLSQGTLGAECVPTLTAGAFAHLDRLDLRYHYLSDDDLTRIRAALPTTQIDAGDAQAEEEWGRFVAVGE